MKVRTWIRDNEQLRAAGNRIASAVEFLSEAFFMVSKASLVLMMILVTATTAGRYFFGRPLVGTVEFVTYYLMVATVFLSVAKVQEERANVKVDVFSRKFPAQTRQVISLVSGVLAVGVFALVAKGGAEVGWSHFIKGASTGGVNSLPTAYSWFIMAAGFAVFCAVVVLQMTRTALDLVDDGNAVEPGTVTQTDEEVER